MDFLLKYYLYFVGVLVVFILGIIGYLVDSYKNEKFRKQTIKKEIKKDIPRIKEATNEIIENLNIEDLSNKTISSLQNNNANMSSQAQELETAEPVSNAQNLVANNQNDTTKKS